jgi:hypothetical protein
VPVEQNVETVDVSMDNAASVNEVESFGNLYGPPQRPLFIDGVVLEIRSDAAVGSILQMDPRFECPVVAKNALIAVALNKTARISAAPWPSLLGNPHQGKP